MSGDGRYFCTKLRLFTSVFANNVLAKREVESMKLALFAQQKQSVQESTALSLLKSASLKWIPISPARSLAVLES